MLILANSPETYRIRASLEGSVRLALLGAGGFCGAPDCAGPSARIRGRNEMFSPEREFPAKLRSGAGKTGSFGKSAAANAKTSSEMGSQLDIANRHHPRAESYAIL